MMEPKRLVLHHRDADGFGAAFACHHAFRKMNPDLTGPSYTDDTVYVGVQYNEPLPSQAYAPWDEIYIVDFSYPLETLLALAQDCLKVVVIDHHKTAEETLREFNKEMDRRDRHGAATLSVASFHTNYSGAELTWEHLHGAHAPTPAVLLYVGDRDLWKWDLPNSREVNLYIASLPWDFAVWDRFDLNTAVAAGSAIAAYEDQIIESRVKAAVQMFFAETSSGQVFFLAKDGYFGERLAEDGCKLIPIVNCTACISEVGNALCKAYPEAPFSMTYCDRPDGLRSYSLRSIGDFDVSVVAAAMGGGGHQRSAGFSRPSPNII